MIRDLDIMRKLIAKHDDANRLIRLNDELCDHLLGSIVWLCKYSERYSIPLPKKEELYAISERTRFLLNEISYAKQNDLDLLQTLLTNYFLSSCV
jgi:hypothetical protein